MIHFEYEGEAFELEDSLSFSLEIDSPLFSQDTIAGTQMYSFSIPNSPKNRELLEFVHLLGVIPRQIELAPVRMFISGQLYKVGRFVIREATDTHTQVSFHSDAGALNVLASTKLSSLDIGISSLTYDHGLSYPDRKYALPVVYNPGFYGDANPDFKGYINYYNKGNPANKDKNLYTVVPMVYLMAVLEAVAKMTGYSMYGGWHQDPDVQKLLIWNNRSLDMKSINLNLYAKEFKLSDHLPDMTVGQMLVDLQNMFGLAIFVDPVAKLIHFRKKSDIINSVYYQDLTAIAGRTYNKALSAYTGFELVMQPDSSDDLFRNQAFEWMNYAIDGGGEKIRTNASPLNVELRQDVARKWVVPTVSQLANSPAFNLSGKLTALRLMFYMGMQPDTFGVKYPQANDTSIGFSLRWGGYKGLYTKFYSRWLMAMKDAFRVEREMHFNLEQFLSLDLGDKIMIEGQKYLIEKVRLGVKRTDKDLNPARVTLLHIPF